jgi:hypothetical protein
LALYLPLLDILTCRFFEYQFHLLESLQHLPSTYTWKNRKKKTRGEENKKGGGRKEKGK